MYFFAQPGNWSTDAMGPEPIKRPSSETFVLAYIDIKNAGKVQVEKVEVKITIDGQVNMKTLDEKIDPDRTNHYHVLQDLPNSTGKHTVQVQLNPDKKISESDYGNNGASFEYTVE